MAGNLLLFNIIVAILECAPLIPHEYDFAIARIEDIFRLLIVCSQSNRKIQSLAMIEDVFFVVECSLNRSHDIHVSLVDVNVYLLVSVRQDDYKENNRAE